MLRWHQLEGLIGATIVGTIVLLVAAASLLAPHPPEALLGSPWTPPGSEAWLGLDNLGRDMLSRLLHGGRISLAVAFGSTLLCFALGLSGGLVAAVRGGWTDRLLARGVDALMSIPTLIFALVILSVVGASMTSLMLAIGVLSATRVFRLSRALASTLLVTDYIEAARLRREPLGWLMLHEVLPNMRAPLLTEFGLRLSANFLLIASLSFLGLGVPPPAADWGGMVRDNATVIGFGGLAPLFPAAAIGLFSLGVHLLVDWHAHRRTATPQDPL